MIDLVFECRRNGLPLYLFILLTVRFIAHSRCLLHGLPNFEVPSVSLIMPAFLPRMKQGQNTATASNTNRLSEKIGKQIDNIIFVHKNPSRVDEIEKTLTPPKDPTALLDRCVKIMENINSKLTLSGNNTTNVLSVKEQMEYLYERRKGKFDAERCYRLLSKNLSADALPNEKRSIKTKGRTLSYEFKEKLTGFVTKKGSTLWSDERIDEFIGSMMS